MAVLSEVVLLIGGNGYARGTGVEVNTIKIRITSRISQIMIKIRITGKVDFCRFGVRLADTSFQPSPSQDMVLKQFREGFVITHEEATC